MDIARCAEVYLADNQFDTFEHSTNLAFQTPDFVGFEAFVAFLKGVGVDRPREVALNVLGEFRSIPEILAASIWRLAPLVGLRVARIIQQLKSLLEAFSEAKLRDAPILENSAQVLEFIKLHSGYLTRERLSAIYVDAALRVLRVQILAEGSVSSAPIDKAAILRWGLDVGASGFILIHNHPSGDPTPSEADKLITGQLRQVARLLEMPLIRHIVVARGKIAYVDALPMDLSARPSY